MARYPTIEVSAKAALLSHDLSQVLVMEYLPAKGYVGYGLPGGHVEVGEHPDAAVTRELQEELGFEVQNVERAGFYVHRTGKLILGYTGILSARLHSEPQQSDTEVGRWLSEEAFDGIVIDPAYRELVSRSLASHRLVRNSE